MRGITHGDFYSNAHRDAAKKRQSLTALGLGDCCMAAYDQAKYDVVGDFT